jgi:hypothetical protein
VKQNGLCGTIYMIVIIFAAGAHFFICVGIHTLADPNQQRDNAIEQATLKNQ